MRNIFLAICLAFTLTGCPGSLMVHEKPVSVKEDPVKATQQVIDQGNAAIVAAARTVIDNYLAGAITAEDKNNYARTLREAGNRLDEAQVFLDTGETVLAQDKAQAAQMLIKFVKSKLIDLKGGVTNG